MEEVSKQVLKQGMLQKVQAGESLSVDELHKMRLELQQGMAQAVMDAPDVSEEEKQQMVQRVASMDVQLMQQAAKEVQQELDSKPGNEGGKLVVQIDWAALQGSWQLPSWSWPKGPSMSMGGVGMKMPDAPDAPRVARSLRGRRGPAA